MKSCAGAGLEPGVHGCVHARRTAAERRAFSLTISITQRDAVGRGSPARGYLVILARC